VGKILTVEPERVIEGSASLLERHTVLVRVGSRLLRIPLEQQLRIYVICSGIKPSCSRARHASCLERTAAPAHQVGQKGHSAQTHVLGTMEAGGIEPPSEGGPRRDLRAYPMI
jgi:hypothetical protein